MGTVLGQETASLLCGSIIIDETKGSYKKILFENYTVCTEKDCPIIRCPANQNHEAEAYRVSFFGKLGD